MKNEHCASYCRRVRSVWRSDSWVKPYFARYKKALFVSLGLGVLTLVFAAMLMFVSGFLISYAALPPELGLFSLFFPIGLVQIFGIGKPFLGYFERLASHDWVLHMTSSLRKRLYCAFEAEGIVGAQVVAMGEALGLLSEDIAHVQNLYLRTVFPLLAAWALGGLVVLFLGVMSVPCALMVFVGFVVIALILPLWSVLARGVRIERTKALKAEQYVSAYDNVLGIGDWVCAQRRNDFCASVMGASKESEHLEKELASSSRRRGLLLDVVFALLLVGLLVWTGEFFGSGNPGSGAKLAGSVADGQPGVWIAAFVLGFFPLLEAFRPLPDAAVGAAAHLDSVRRLNELGERDTVDEGEDCPGPSDVAICLDKVSFSYEEGQAPLLGDISISIAPGQKLAILGASGSGKSTLLHLIHGDLEPEAGSVSIGGVSSSRLAAAGRISGFVGYLQQSSYLFAQSLMGNLKIGNPQVTEGQSEDALVKVGLQSLLDRLPDGLSTTVDEAGLRFSGGERQRIALARLLLADTPVVLMDEPTVGLDPLTEAKLLDTVFDVLEDRTVIMVTHHLQGVEHMDRVLFVQDGRIIMDGDPRELAANNPLFRELLAFDRGE